MNASNREQGDQAGQVPDITPLATKGERRSTELLLADLTEISTLARTLGITSDAADFETGLSTDDMLA